MNFSQKNATYEIKFEKNMKSMPYVIKSKVMNLLLTHSNKH